MLKTRIGRVLTFGICLAALAPLNAQKPLVNADIIEMVKNNLPESTIVGSMQANPTNFDLSPAAMIALHQAGVSSKIMDAMLATGKTPAARRGRTAAARTTRVAPSSVAAPSVTLVRGTERQTLPLERTGLMQTTAKASSLGALAKDRLVTQGLRTGVSEAARRTGGMAGSAVGQVAGGLVPRGSKSRDVTYVWAIEGASAETAVPATATFEVAPGTVAGVKPGEYVPAIVELTPAANNSRLVGATEGRQSSSAASAVDWPIYTNFIEDRVPAQVTKLPSGSWQVSVTTPLAPGEYAVVLRPVSKDKRFAGQDVARNKGDGLLFNAIWSFVVN